MPSLHAVVHGDSLQAFRNPSSPNVPRQIREDIGSEHRKIPKTANTFRFFDLPKELRLIVYELLTVLTRHDQLSVSYRYTVKKLHRGEVNFTMVNKSVPGIFILATCRLINEEARPLLRPLVHHVIQQPPRLSKDVKYAVKNAVSPASPLAAVIGYCSGLTRQLLMTRLAISQAVLEAAGCQSSQFRGLQTD
jgi:hypothetical protein